MDPQSTLKETETAMSEVVEYLKGEFATVRTGKASPALIENLDIYVASYGTQMKLKELAVISAPEPRMLLVSPFDPSTAQEIEKGIRESKLGLNPAAGDRSIRVPIPQLSEERRKEMVKLVRSMSEDAKVSIRGSRKDGMDAAKKMKAENILTEDTQKTFENDVQKLTDKYVKEVEEVTTAKEEDVMRV